MMTTTMMMLTDVSGIEGNYSCYLLIGVLLLHYLGPILTSDYTTLHNPIPYIKSASKQLTTTPNQVLNVRVGPGAAVLPTPPSATPEFPAITRLHLTYARKIYNGHQGARHFWRNCLPRLKYHNPSIPMTVKQTEEQEGPAALTIYFAEKLSNAASVSNNSNKSAVDDKYAPAAGETEKKAVVDVRDLDFKKIWDKVRVMTGAKEVEASNAEEEEVKKLERMRVQSEKDRERNLSIRQAKKDQERMLQEARGEVERLRQM